MPTIEENKHSTHINSNTSNAKTKLTTNNGGVKLPISTGMSFAERMAAIQSRMGGKGGGSNSGTTPSNNTNNNNINNNIKKESSKPIVELCEGNTKRMDINKIIGNLEKEKKKKVNVTSSKPVEVKVISGKGSGIPPPPPPPPPPKFKK